MRILQRVLVGLCLVVVLIYAGIWAGSPLLVRTALKGVLEEKGLRLSDTSVVRLNLFRSRVHISDVLLTKDTVETYSLKKLSLEYSIWRLLSKEFRVRKLILSGMDVAIEIDKEKIYVAGVDTAGETTQATAPKADASNSQEPLDFKFSAPEVIFENLRFHVNNNSNLHEINIDTLKIIGSEYAGGVFSSDIQFSGSLDDAKLEFKASIDGDESDSHLTVDLHGINSSLKSIQYLLPEGITQLNFASELNMNLSAQFDGENIVLNDSDLELKLENLNLEEQRLIGTLKELNLKIGELKSSFNINENTYAAAGALRFGLLELGSTLPASGDSLIKLGELDLGDFKFNAKSDELSITTDKIRLEELDVSEIKDSDLPLGHIKSIAISGIEATAQKLIIDNLALGGGEANLHIGGDGNIKTLVNTDSLTGEENPSSPDDVQSDIENKESTEKDKEAPPLRVALNKFEMLEPFGLHIEDQSNNYAFKKSFYITQLQATKLDTAAANENTNFELKVKDEEYFTATFDGWLRPFSKKMNLSVKGNAKEFPLPEVAPYLRDSLEMEVQAGQLDAVISAVVTDDIVDSNAVLLLRGAKFGSSQQANNETSLIGQTAIPLNVAMNMLKDSDGNIKLKIPVTGNVQDPDFGIGHVVRLIVKKVAMSQAKNYLITMFVPYAKVVSVAVSAGEEALKVRFSDLIYSPAQIEPSEEHIEFINQFSLLLKDKPDLQVRVCPIATPEDIQLPLDTELTEAQRTQLLDIAKARGKAFKTYVVNQSGIESSRLLLCSAKVSSGEKAKAKIDFKT